MLTFPPGAKVFLATGRVDGRKGINGLSAIVRSQFAQDPLSGQLFVFFSRRADSASCSESVARKDRVPSCCRARRYGRNPFLRLSAKNRATEWCSPTRYVCSNVPSTTSSLGVPTGKRSAGRDGACPDRMRTCAGPA